MKFRTLPAANSQEITGIASLHILHGIQAACVAGAVQHFPSPQGFCTFPWEPSCWQQCERANTASSHSPRHARISCQNLVQTNISLTAILTCHSILFNTSSYRPAVIFQVLQTHKASSFQAQQLKKEPKYTTVFSNLAQMSHIFVLIFSPGEDLKAIAFPGY